LLDVACIVHPVSIFASCEFGKLLCTSTTRP
jgi:hypothetical protein